MYQHPTSWCKGWRSALICRSPEEVRDRAGGMASCWRRGTRPAPDASGSSFLKPCRWWRRRGAVFSGFMGTIDRGWLADAPVDAASSSISEPERRLPIGSVAGQEFDDRPSSAAPVTLTTGFGLRTPLSSSVARRRHGSPRGRRPALPAPPAPRGTAFSVACHGLLAMVDRCRNVV